jgi:diphosphomevalonate decarboxylase
VSRCIDRVLGRDRQKAVVTSECNFPIAAGLASSASAFAATVVAAAALGKKDIDTAGLASLAGATSGSAARSLYAGFAELRNEQDDIAVQSLRQPGEWPLKIVVAVTTAASKLVSSGDAMEISRKTSPFYSSWVEKQHLDLDAARAAIRNRDFEALGSVAEHNCLKMHSVMWASRPAMVYWNSATLNCLQTVRALQADGVSAFFTIDAGPQVKVVCLPQYEADVRAALQATEGVTATMVSGLGCGAALVDR